LWASWVDGTASPHLNGPPSTSSWPVNCEVGAAWRLKEAFADIYDSADRAEAGRRFDDWMRRVEGSGLSELAATARVVDSGADPQLLRRSPDQRLR